MSEQLYVLQEASTSSGDGWAWLMLAIIMQPLRPAGALPFPDTRKRW